jgi:hypothetical protein
MKELTMRTSKRVLTIGLLMLFAAPAMGKVADKLSATLPEGWKSADTGKAIVMVPGDARTGADGAEEAYIMMVTETPEGASLKDPEVVKATLLKLSQTFEGFELADKPKICDVAGQKGIRSGLPWVKDAWSW